MEGTFNIKDMVYAKLKVENQAAAASNNLVGGFIVEEGTHCAVPLMQIKFLNRNLEYGRKEFALNEGTLAHLTIGRDPSSSTEKVFRLFGQKQVQHSGGGGPILEATFVLNAPTYMSGVYRECFEGNSSAIMGGIAGSGGLGYSGPLSSTSDKMVWLNVCQTRSAFAEDVALHGYQSAKSTMLRCVSSTRKLLYKNLFENLAQSPTATFLLNAPGSEGTGKKVLATQLKPQNSAGAYTNWINYGYKHAYHSLTGIQKKVDAFDASKVGVRALPINADVKGAVNDTARVEYDFRLDCDNCHCNYVKAMYQNMRGRALFSQRVAVLTQMVSNVELMDTVQVLSKQITGNDTQAEDYVNGVYLVISKSARISEGNVYTEKFVLARAGVTEPGRTSLV